MAKGNRKRGTEGAWRDYERLPKLEDGPMFGREPDFSPQSRLQGVVRASKDADGETTTEALHAPRFDRASLTVLAGPDVGAVYGLSEAITVFGRGRDCHIQLDHSSVSRHHARVLREADDAFFVEDLDSKNGTSVGGKKVERCQLRDGDRIGFGPHVFMRFAFISQSEQEGLRNLYESTMLDPLTSAVNRRYFNLRLGGEIAYAKRHGTTLSFLLLDVDRFKQVNDTYGHLAGDHVLQTIATRIRATLRAEDVIARYGGEEFGIIARGLDLYHAMLFAERVRKLVEETVFKVGDDCIPVTVSIGVASFDCVGVAARTLDFIRVADERLYRAKQDGRNRCVGR